MKWFSICYLPDLLPLLVRFCVQSGEETSHCSQIHLLHAQLFGNVLAESKARIATETAPVCNIDNIHSGTNDLRCQTIPRDGTFGTCGSGILRQLDSDSHELFARFLEISITVDVLLLQPIYLVLSIDGAQLTQ